ncbi:MAG: glutamyl-tRNA reductase [Solirubrobacteraceae bacterium]
MNELLALGISHKTAPVALRERLAFSQTTALDFAAELIGAGERANGSEGSDQGGQGGQDGPAATEAVVLSTCNRTEIYQVTADPVRAEAHALSLLARRAAIRPTELAGSIYSPRNCDAARQLFRVTAGLESMIVGEAEIQGQVRRSYEAATDAGHTGPLIDRLFTAAITTGKRVRSETAIGASRVSIPSVAVDLASGTLGTLAERQVIILGAGETSELTAEALARQGAGTVFVANRHADRARSIAERFGGSVVSLEGLPDQLLEADIVVSSTSSPHHILGAEELDLVMGQRSERPLLLIDIAVPRDIDPRCGELEGVTLYDIDDLQEALDHNLNRRAEEVPQAERIVEQEIRRFARWLGQVDTLPTVRALREQADTLVAQIVAENASRWESASPADRARAEAIARAVAKRLLHEPTVRLRALSGARRHSALELVRDLFALGGDADADSASGARPHRHSEPEQPDASAPGELAGSSPASRALQAAAGADTALVEPEPVSMATVHSLRERRRR